MSPSSTFLSFYVELLRYVVVELKVGRFKPEHASQLSFYVKLVEDRLRRPAHGGDSMSRPELRNRLRQLADSVDSSFIRAL